MGGPIKDGGINYDSRKLISDAVIAMMNMLINGETLTGFSTYYSGLGANGTAIGKIHIKLGAYPGEPHCKYTVLSCYEAYSE